MSNLFLRSGVQIPPLRMPPEEVQVLQRPEPTNVHRPPLLPRDEVKVPPEQLPTNVSPPGEIHAGPSALRMPAQPSAKEAGKKAIALAKQVLGDTFNNSIDPKQRRSVAAAVNELARRALDPKATEGQIAELLDLGQQLIVAGRDAGYLPGQNDFEYFVAAKAQPPNKPTKPPPELPANPQQPANSQQPANPQQPAIAPSQQPPPSTEKSAEAELPESLRLLFGL